jgi:hypothetical protein
VTEAQAKIGGAMPWDWTGGRDNSRPQRGHAPKPKVARHELPWEGAPSRHQPQPGLRPLELAMGKGVNGRRWRGHLTADGTGWRGLCHPAGGRCWRRCSAHTRSPAVSALPAYVQALGVFRIHASRPLPRFRMRFVVVVPAAAGGFGGGRSSWFGGRIPSDHRRRA